MAKVGRPTSYTRDLGDAICEGISRKTPLARLCDENDSMPSPRTVYRWLRTEDEFCQNYTRAKEDQADYLAEECLEIADSTEFEPQDKRIRVDIRKWLASKFQPKKYGDRIFQETKHSGIIGMKDLSQMSDEELQAELEKGD